MTMAAMNEDGSDLRVDRLTATYVNQAERFVVQKSQFSAQYAQIYFTRLMRLAPVLRARATSTWPGIPLTKILCLEEGREMVVVGTLFKEMKLRPTILLEYTNDTSISELLKASRFCEDSDSLVMEDESARVSLAGTHLDVQKLVTGVIAAVRGTFNATTGVLTVTDHLFAGLPPQKPLPSLGEDKYIAIVSGLGIGGSGREHYMLLLDWLKGLLGGEEEVETCRRVVRLVIAGGSLAGSENLAAAAPGSKQQAFAMDAVHEVDQCICELASALPVDVMPGPGDLSNAAMPQQPLNRCLFPSAAAYESFHRVSNPYECQVDGVQILGTSGQNVADIQRYSTEDDMLNVMEANLQQRHLCPTAPDTLACHPFTDREPFIIDECPHLYFAGNQKRFAHRQVEGSAGQRVSIVSVPAFSHTGMLVLFNLRTQECQPINFDAAL